jgi:CRISPR-associated protein Cas5d
MREFAVLGIVEKRPLEHFGGGNMYNDEAFVGLEGFREWIQGRNESMLVCRCALTGRTVFAVDVWGDFACFTDPEGKTERISYPIPTHSALRGILSSVFCEPREFQWKILRCEILSPPERIALRLNEVQSVGRLDLENPRKNVPVDTAAWRTQRMTQVLANPEYRIWARMDPFPTYEGKRIGNEIRFAKRLLRGQWYRRPFLGMSNFPGYVAPGNLEGYRKEGLAPVASMDGEFPLMLFDVNGLRTPVFPKALQEFPNDGVGVPRGMSFFAEAFSAKSKKQKKAFLNQVRSYFRPRLIKGVVVYPEYEATIRELTGRETQ